MTGRDLVTHLREDGAVTSLWATLAIVGTVMTVSGLVWLWERHRARRLRRPR